MHHEFIFLNVIKNGKILKFNYNKHGYKNVFSIFLIQFMNGYIQKNINFFVNLYIRYKYTKRIVYLYLMHPCMKYI